MTSTGGTMPVVSFGTDNRIMSVYIHMYVFMSVWRFCKRVHILKHMCDYGNALAILLIWNTNKNALLAKANGRPCSEDAL